MSPNYQYVAENIKSLRRKNGNLTQEELAKMTGIDRRQLGRYESGQVCGYDKIIKIAAALNVKPGVLLENNQENSP